MNYDYICDGCGQRIAGLPTQHEEHGIIWDLCNGCISGCISELHNDCSGPKFALPTESAVGEVYRED